MKFNEAEIRYFGKLRKVTCDRNCKKAWGISSRPYKQLSDNEDDIVYLSDSELGEAPDDPETYEGLNMEGKPLSPDHFPNRWCVRECERCAKGENKLKDWTKRVYNIKQKEII